ncbi:hypothetical protein [Tychonema sp. LEGE 07203]|uniref:hypothetical protein n=1 Tax=Tychonema sp. LEGE 07203 TaxID=1828671 RepID=UPI00187F5BBD|nr:hypothetical protein [Tychonema sp. LEGE 07203]MBE9093156.1 hypothetical protein [Tychonema sp. LEGE 07203]
MITPVADLSAACLGYGLSIDMIGKFNKLDRTAFCFSPVRAPEHKIVGISGDRSHIVFCLQNRDRAVRSN